MQVEEHVNNIARREKKEAKKRKLEEEARQGQLQSEGETEMKKITENGTCTLTNME